MWRDLERICEGQGLPFRKPSTFPRGSLPAARVAASFMDAPWIGRFVRAVYTASFAEDLEIGEPSVVGELLTSIGLDAAPVLEEVRSDPGKLRLRQLTNEAARAGIFGAPSFVSGDELSWGNDRLEAAVEWAKRRRS
jgi:2-hydroxychromene-2-carboxylate isomerase